MIALFNTLFRFSESIRAVDDFRREWKELDEAESRKLIKETERTTSARVGQNHDEF